MTSRTRLLVLFVSAPIIAFAVVGGLLGNVGAREETYQHLRVFEQVVSLVTANYVEDVDVDRVMRGAMRGLAEGLDPDSAYLSPTQVRLYQKGDRAPGETGLDLTRQYYLAAISVRDDSPAARAGFRAGDFVRAVDGKPTRETSVVEGERLLDGPIGSKVTLTVIRGNAADPRQVTLTREALPPARVSGRLLGDGIGYVRIPGFTPATEMQLKTKAAELAQGGAARLVVDVRSSSSGSLEDGLAAARAFVPSGTLAVRESRGAGKQPIRANAGDGAITLPAVVLIDLGTSGPAELFAAALQGNSRADLVGERTHGRVAVQTLVPLPDGSGILVPTAWYLNPAGEIIQDKGLVPQVEVDLPDIEFGAPLPTPDPILQKGIEQLASKK